MTLRLELIAALKRQLKAQGITYARLAQALGLSEAAVKRMFSRQALSLVRLEQICTVLGIGLAELAIQSRQGQASLAELDAESEDALVREPALLLALYLVLSRWSEAEVLARYRFSPVEWTALLVRLDRMGVLELQPGNRVRLRTARNFRWRKGGPMQRFFQQKLLPEYFGKDFDTDEESLFLLSGMVSASSAAHMQRRLAELGEEFDLLMAQDAGLPAARRQGVSLVLAQRPWSLRLFAGLRRTSDG
jgi:transcriptional regulator with XRE-family HTH domain